MTKLAGNASAATEDGHRGWSFTLRASVTWSRHGLAALRALARGPRACVKARGVTLHVSTRSKGQVPSARWNGVTLVRAPARLFGRRRSAFAHLLCLGWVLGRLAQPLPACADTPDPLTALQAFLDERLDPAAEAETALELDLGRVPASRLLGELNPEPPELGPLQQALTLGPQALTALTHSHRARQEAAAEAREAEAHLVPLLERYRARAEGLEALVGGERAVDGDPRPWLRIDLLHFEEAASGEARVAALRAGLAQGARAYAPRGPGEEDSAPHEALSPSRAAQTLKAERTEALPNAPSEALPLAAQLEAWCLRGDTALGRMLALPLEAREALLAAHGQRLQAGAANEGESDRTARERQEAQEAAGQAEDLLARVLAEHRVTLLDVKAAQARFTDTLTTRSDALDDLRDTGRHWTRQVIAVAARPDYDPRRAVAADAAYEGLTSELETARQRLARALSDIGALPKEAPEPPKLKLPKEATADEGADIEQLRADLEDAATNLRKQARKLAWAEAEIARDLMTTLGNQRLVLLPLTSHSRARSLRGFGPEGMRQAARESRQIALSLRYQLLALPRAVESTGTSWRDAPIPVLFVALKLLVLVLVFRRWRRRADSLLGDAQTRVEARRPQTPSLYRASVLLWYLRQVRSPLEWWLLALVLRHVVLTGARIPDFGFVWTFANWILGGAFFVASVNALAERQKMVSGRDAGTQTLRLRSLRLVGHAVVAMGLALSLTAASVGKGTIYAWMVTLCWVVVLPLFAQVVAWWRVEIQRRAAAKRVKPAILSWVLAREPRPLSLGRAAVGGVYLLGEGLGRFIGRYSANLSMSKRILAYLFRRTLERSGNDARTGCTLAPLSAVQAHRLGPQYAAGRPRVAGVIDTMLAAYREKLAAGRVGISALVGERGAGRTTFIEALTLYGDVLRLEVGDTQGTCTELRAQLCHALALPPTADDESLAQALRARAPRLVAIDNGERLIRPVIGGLRDFDALLSLMRGPGNAVPWLVALQAPAWHYIERARGEGLPVDDVLKLGPWNEDALRALIEARTESAQLEVDFRGLLAGRVEAFEAEDALRLRARRDYFRMLWDLSRGNPAVALALWRDSLRQSEREGLVLPQVPALPQTSLFDQAPASLFFVLRAAVQQDGASASELIHISGLPAADVAGALRFGVLRGLFERRDDRYRIALRAYARVVQVLRRRHLMLL